MASTSFGRLWTIPFNTNEQVSVIQPSQPPFVVSSVPVFYAFDARPDMLHDGAALSRAPMS